MGLSGAGKSTFVSLLMQLRVINAGRIIVHDVIQTSLREQIGVVTQDVGLLDRSISDNIRYGCPNATCAEATTKARASFTTCAMTRVPGT